MRKAMAIWDIFSMYDELRVPSTSDVAPGIFPCHGCSTSRAFSVQTIQC